MAVPFYLPEGSNDDVASSSPGTSGASSPTSSGSSSGASTSSGASDGASSIASQSPNTTTSATQTPMQSPHTMPTDQVLIALCEWYQQHQHQRQYNYNVNATAPQIFQYPPPPSPSCYTGGDTFFAHGIHVAPRTPHTSSSFGEEHNYFRQPYPPPSTPQPQPMPPQPPAPQSAPPLRYSHSYPQQSSLLLQHHAATYGHPLPAPAAGAYYATYTPPPTPNAVNASTSSLAAAPFGHQHYGAALTSTPLAPTGPKMRLQRSQSDAARRKRLTSTGEDEREYQSDHETSWDEFDDRYDNFTAGRERLQEFSGRIPPRKKKTGSHSNTSSASHGESGGTEKNCSKQREQRDRAEQKNHQSFTWPTVVTVFVLAIGCVFFAAR
ncbi:hypothetical protein KR222_003443 [Zaprionus bogoriensis]|nr:hypothetical protein KR222_003443 [Zaprionus bogoriensis]